MSAERGADGERKERDDARRAVTFMAVKFALFAVLPVVVAVAIVALTLPG